MCVAYSNVHIRGGKLQHKHFILHIYMNRVSTRITIKYSADERGESSASQKKTQFISNLKHEIKQWRVFTFKVCAKLLQCLIYYHINWILVSNVWFHYERGCFNYVTLPNRSASTLKLQPAPRGIRIYMMRLVALMRPYNVVISPLSEDCQVTTHL